jgi:hypothetical protein
MTFWFWFFFGIATLIVITQTITTWYVFEGFSGMENAVIKRFQSVSFCTIISLIIIGSVFIGVKWLAFTGAVIEVLINFFYYAKDFWQNGFKAFTGDKAEISRKRKNSVLKFWRQYWLKFIFGIIIPVAIYICAELMLTLQ